MLYTVYLLALGDDTRRHAAARVYFFRAAGSRWQARLFRPPIGSIQFPDGHDPRALPCLAIIWRSDPGVGLCDMSTPNWCAPEGRIGETILRLRPEQPHVLAPV